MVNESPNTPSSKATLAADESLRFIAASEAVSWWKDAVSQNAFAVQLNPSRFFRGLHRQILHWINAYGAMVFSCGAGSEIAKLADLHNVNADPEYWPDDTIMFVSANEVAVQQGENKPEVIWTSAP